MVMRTHSRSRTPAIKTYPKCATHCQHKPGLLLERLAQIHQRRTSTAAMDKGEKLVCRDKCTCLILRTATGCGRRRWVDAKGRPVLVSSCPTRLCSRRRSWSRPMNVFSCWWWCGRSSPRAWQPAGTSRACAGRCNQTRARSSARRAPRSRGRAAPRAARCTQH